MSDEADHFPFSLAQKIFLASEFRTAVVYGNTASELFFFCESASKQFLLRPSKGQCRCSSFVKDIEFLMNAGAPIKLTHKATAHKRVNMMLCC
jgi:hypothetical protein